MKLFSDYRAKQTIAVNGVTYTAVLEVLEKTPKGTQQYRWTAYSHSSGLATRAVTTSPRFSAVEPQLRATLLAWQA